MARTLVARQHRIGHVSAERSGVARDHDLDSLQLLGPPHGVTMSVSTHVVVTVASPRWVVPSEVPVQESHKLLGVGSRQS